MVMIKTGDALPIKLIDEESTEELKKKAEEVLLEKNNKEKLTPKGVASQRSTSYNLKSIKEDLSGFLNKIIGRSPMIVTTFVYMSREWFKQEMDITMDQALLWTTLEVQGWDVHDNW